MPFVLTANAILLGGLALIFCNLFVWRRSPRYLGEALMALSVVALFFLLKGFGL